MGCLIENDISKTEIETQINEIVNNLDIEGDRLSQLRIQNGFRDALAMGFEKEKYSIHTDSILIDIFKTKDKYVFIRFEEDIDNNKVGLFQIKNDSIKLVFEETVEIGFSHSYVEDINGDDYLDVITSYYSPSGCCRRNLETVRIYNPDSNSFEKGIQFMNPTFDVSNHIVRGVVYGHPGIIPIYKFKWNNLKIDTIEYLYPIENQKNTFLVSKGTYRKEAKKKFQINYLPDEYKNIKEIDWFLDY